MIIYYLAAVCPQRCYEYLYPEGAVSPAYTFNKLLAEGFCANANVKVRCIVPWVVLEKLKEADLSSIVVEEGVEYEFLQLKQKKGYLPFLCEALKVISKAAKQDRVVVVCDALSINFSMISLLSKWLHGVTNVAIITDFLHYLGEDKKSLKVKIMDGVNMWQMRKFDRYVLLTYQMGQHVNKKHKPQCIVEGICSVKQLEISKDKYSQKVCMYAGSLHREYGIELLTEAFVKAAVSNSELHIYGDGDYKEELLEICKKHRNVIYRSSSEGSSS